jgi:succinate dehydrogenase / fumarate reductase, cytochrome b subunit
MAKGDTTRKGSQWDWLAAGRSGWERPAYILHRITGLGILLYFLLHIVITSFRAKGLYLWEEPYPLEEFKFGDFVVFAAFAYHAFNGLRLLLVDVGVPVGIPFAPAAKTPSRPVLRPLLMFIMLLACLFVVAGGYQFVTAVE